MSDATTGDDRRATDGVAATFRRAGAVGFLHARDLDGTGELGLAADEPVAVASVIKIVFAIAFAREVAAGRLDPGHRIEVPAKLRVGGSGTAGFVDTPLISLRDLALTMMTVSDNAATDLVYAHLGPAAIADVLCDIGLRDTHVRSDMSSAGRRVAAELGFPDERDIDARLAAADPAAVRALAWLDPRFANASTPREITALLRAIWTDAAGPHDACAFVRAAMAQQMSTQRLASGFDADTTVAGKTGTLPGIRNEAGVVQMPDGRRFAVAVFTRCESLADRNPEVDAAIGAAARIVVRALGGS